MPIDFVSRWNRAAAAERAEKFRESESARDIERERLAQERRRRADALGRFQVLHSLATPLHIAGIYDDDEALAELMHNLKTTATDAGLQYEMENPRALADLGASDHMFKVVTEGSKNVQRMSADDRGVLVDSITDRLMSGPYGTVYLWRVAQDNLGAGAGAPEEEVAPGTPEEVAAPSPPAEGEVVTPAPVVPEVPVPEVAPTGPLDARGQIRALVDGMLGQSTALDPNQLAIRRGSGLDRLEETGWDSVTGGLIVDYETQMGAVADTPAARASRMADLEERANLAYSARVGGQLNTALEVALGEMGGTLEAGEVAGFFGSVNATFTASVGRPLNNKEAQEVRRYADSAVRAGRGVETRMSRLYDDIIQGYQAGLEESSLAPLIQEYWELGGGVGSYPEGYMRAPSIRPVEEERLRLAEIRATTAAANATARREAEEAGLLKQSQALAEDGRIFDDYERLSREAAGALRTEAGVQVKVMPTVERAIAIEGAQERLQTKGDSLAERLREFGGTASVSSEMDIVHSRAVAERLAAMGRNPRWTGSTAAQSLRDSGATESEIGYFMNKFFWPSRPEPEEEGFRLRLPWGRD